ncbi:unnamed protein product [Clonostachys rosea f. rosea IK726]|uniref:Uncharacterized protein n=1 Tax=Clonostachys rosea f. rosea IK726 TaxID=1349383 RepID=A0ACA9UPP9_BIOOC|nr:unnamed protein product [Clonostachys rosea f. rosea IK726]
MIIGHRSCSVLPLAYFNQPQISLMARLQNKKRQRPDDALLQDHSGNTRPVKKSKTRSEIEYDNWVNWKPPPGFYDRLSKIHLIHKALEEFDRRTKTQRHRHLRPRFPFPVDEHVSGAVLYDDNPPCYFHAL